MKRILCLFSTLLLLGIFANAQKAIQPNSSSLEVDVQVTYAEYLGKTPPIRQLTPQPGTDKEKRGLAKKNKRAPKDFLGRGKRGVAFPDLEHQGPDPVRQTTFNKNTGTVVEPIVNIDGITSGGAPNDPSGAVGKDHYVQAINATTIAVFDKEGNLETSFSANTLWNSIGFGSAGDPIVLYDAEVDRWIITEFPPSNQLLFAISDDSDPLGSYTAYSFATPNFPDYPKYGIWSNAYSVTTNEGGSGTLHAYFINRAQLLNGDAMVQIQRIGLPGTNNSEQNFIVATPVHWMGPSTDADPIIVSLNDSSWGDVAEDAINVFTVNIDWDDENNTSFTETNIVVSPYDGFPCSVPGAGFSCVPQGGGGGGLDAIPEVIMHMPHYRDFGSHESIVLNFVTDVTSGDNLSGIRWVEMRRQPGEDWGLYQEGTFAPDDGLDRYMGNIAIDGSGNIGLAYNVSSEDEFVGVRFTGRKASDPLGEMTVEEYNVVSGTNVINSGGRFGDYSHMSVDPTNERTFWFTTEYANGDQGGDVNTRIVAFELRKDTTDIGPSKVVTPQSADDLTDMETISIEVTNFGLDTPMVFQVGYIFDNGTPFVEEVTYTLEPDSIYSHTFPQTVDMSVVGDYDLKVFTVLDGDQAVLNDTLRTIITKLPRWDAGITAINGLDGTICAEVIPAEIILTNFGTETMTAVTITVMLNDNVFQTINWTGELESGASETVNINLTDFLNGVNEIIATTSMPNGMVDELPINDGFTRTFDAILGGVSVFLNLLTDNFPGETTWEVTNEDGDIFFTGGPYNQNATLFVEEWCLDPEACYTFTIFDSYGDGICCGGFVGNGNYNITDADGIILVESDGQFGSEETTDFCATFMCMLEGDIELSAESAQNANDGTIMIITQNGVGPFQYSIDGGQTFQAENIFTGLAGGDYDIVVQGAADCLYEETVTLPICAIDILVEVTNESEPDTGDGIIEITVINGNANTEYSIDGGQTFQNNNVFNDLNAGDYEIVVQDGVGCSVDGEAMIDIINAVNEFTIGQVIEVFPNPTDGIFRINITGLQQQSVFLDLEIYSADGKVIQYASLVKYDDTYTGLLSLVHYPAGIYYVRFLNDDINKMVKVIRN